MAETQVTASAIINPDADLLHGRGEVHEGESENIDMGFTVERAVQCARLYNEILVFSHTQLAKLTGDAPYEDVKRHDLIHVAARRLNIDPKEYILDSPIYNLLSNLEYVPSGTGARTGGLLTPVLTELLPENIFQLDKERSPHSNEYEEMISLFYGLDAAATDRLVFDYKTGLAFWEEDYPSHISPRQQLRWGPLEFFLTTWLNDWKSGRYYWEANTDEDAMLDEPAFELKMEHWISEDLEAALYAWNSLLDAIEARMPNSAQVRSMRLPPISRRALRRATFDSFSYAFLLRAERPAFKYVGPGLKTLSEDIVGRLAVKQFEDHDPIKNEEDFDGITRGLFVSNTTLETSDENMSGYILCGTTGLYSCPKMILGNYWLAFFRPGDRKMLDYIFLNQNPSNNIRGGATSLHRIFERWRELVEAGVWDVNEDGVSTGTEWFLNDENARSIIIQ